jgi:hypothetical protein
MKSAIFGGQSPPYFKNLATLGLISLEKMLT